MKHLGKACPTCNRSTNTQMSAPAYFMFVVLVLVIVLMLWLYVRLLRAQTTADTCLNVRDQYKGGG